MITEKNKLIILDLDGTLYDINDVLASAYQMQVEFLAAKLHKADGEIKTLLAENDIYPIIKKESKSATEFFLKNGISIQEWTEYRESHFDVSKIDTAKSVNPEILKDFTNKYDTILLSSNSHAIITKIMDRIGIKESFFKMIICSDNYPVAGPFKKIEAMRYLSSYYNIPFINMISIGDRYKTDIEPMIKLGGKGVLVHSPQELEEVFNRIGLS